MDITIRKADIYKEVEKITSITGSSINMEDGSTLYDKVWANEYDQDILDTFWRNAVNTVISLFIRYLDKDTVKHNIIETDRGEILSLKVKMPERFDRRLEGGICDLVSDLLATIVLSGWFELKLPEKVKTYNDKVIALSSEIRGELLYRVSPVRENRKDYGLDNYIFDQVYGKCTDCPSQG